MKTFKLVGMALVAILLCVSFNSCSKDDGPADGKEEEGGGEVVVGEKKLAKVVIKSSDYTETYIFNYDNRGRVIKVEMSDNFDNSMYTETHQFIWGDDAIRHSYTYTGSSRTYNSTLSLKNGLVQREEYGNGDENCIFTYNKSNKLVKLSDSDYWTVNAIWDGDKLMFISDEDGESATFTYGNSCKKGYYPFFASMLEPGEGYILYMAHPEIAGMRTKQLPATVLWDYGYETESSTLSYEFDKEGYISKMKVSEEGYIETAILTWE